MRASLIVVLSVLFALTSATSSVHAQSADAPPVFIFGTAPINGQLVDAGTVIVAMAGDKVIGAIEGQARGRWLRIVFEPTDRR